MSMNPNECPHCRKPGFLARNHCRFCDCKAELNPVSGNVVYMIRGRVVAAPADLRAQWAKKDGKYLIDGPDPKTVEEL